jgi:hypothetical protein
MVGKPHFYPQLCVCTTCEKIVSVIAFFETHRDIGKAKPHKF